MGKITVLIISGYLFGMVCCLNINVVTAENANVEQITDEISKRLDHIQISIDKVITLGELMILQEDLIKIKEKINLLPASKGTEKVKQKFNLVSASLKKERMSIKAEKIGFDSLIPGFESWRFIDEKDLDVLMERFRKIHELYDGYIKKAEDTEYDSDFEWAYKEFEDNVREEFIIKIVLRELRAELKISEQDQKKIEKDIKFRSDELRDIKEELKESRAELKEICRKIDRLKK